MYIALVILQTLILPIISGIIEFILVPSDPILVFGRWFLFWAVGTRLLVAGASQVARPQFTVQNILGSPNEGAAQIAQELGFANLAFGVLGIVGAFVPGWAVPAAIAGGLFLGLAGFRHLPKKRPNLKELVATWSDLLVFVTMAVFVVWSLLH